MKIFKTLLFIGALIFSPVAFADWQAPKDSPPTCKPGDPGCAPPIDVSIKDQIKTGGLGLGTAGPGDFATSKVIIKDGEKLDTIRVESTRVDNETSGSAVRAKQSAFNGIGVYGTGGFMGVLGSSNSGLGAAVAALQSGSGYGFYQYGNSQSKNYFQGRVGIGTDDATESLDATGRVKGRLGLCIGNDCRTAWPGGGPGGDSYWKLQNNNLTASSTAWNVGIGTETPSADAKLEVAGQVKITGGNPEKGKILTSTNAEGLATWETPSGGGGVSKVIGTTGITANPQTGEVTVSLTNPLKSCSSGKAMQAFDLGVGTEPTCVDVGGGGLGGSGTLNRIAKWLTDNTLTDSNISDNGSNVAVNSSLTVDNGALFNFNGEPNTKFIVKGTGNVGIGTNPDPGVKLDVAGAIRSTTGPAMGFYFKDRTQPGTDFAWYASGNKARLWSNSGGADIITLQNTGNVGIGTTDPVSKLSVVSALTQDADATWPLRAGRTANRNQAVVIGYSETADVGMIQGTNTGVAWTPLILNPNGGNVGIGTVIPTAKLDVNGNIKVGNINAGNIQGWDIGANTVSAGNLSAPTICLTGDCRSQWPAGGGGGGVSKIIAGQNVTISPPSGTGDVTINSTAGGGGGGGIGGGGNINNVAKFTSTNTIGNSNIFADGSAVSIAVPTSVSGALTASGNINTTNGQLCIRGDCRSQWTPSCRVNQIIAGSPAYSACSSNETMTGGGGWCEGDSVTLDASFPEWYQGNPPFYRWKVSCSGGVPPRRAAAYALCCSF